MYKKETCGHILGHFKNKRYSSKMIKRQDKRFPDGCAGEGMDDLLAAAMGSGAGSMVGSDVMSLVKSGVVSMVRSCVESLVDFTAWGPTGLW